MRFQTLLLVGCLAAAAEAAKYVCEDGQCVESNRGLGIKECSAICGGVTRESAVVKPQIITRDENMIFKVGGGKEILLTVDSTTTNLVTSLVGAHEKIAALETRDTNLLELINSMNTTIVSQGEAINSLKDELVEARKMIGTNKETLKKTSGHVTTVEALHVKDTKKVNADIKKHTTSLTDLYAVTKKTTDDLAVTDAVAKRDPTAKIRVYSAGYCDNNKVVYSINGKQQEQRGGRGIHVIKFKLDGTEAKMVDYKVFDTHTGYAAQLAAYLKAIPDGTLVGFGCQDACTDALNKAAIKELRLFGSKYVAATAQRESWAMLSFKGTWTGQALEMDGGHASGGTPKGGCGGHGRAAAVEGSFLLGAMHGIQWQTQKKMGQIPANIGELSGLRASHSGILMGGGDWPKCTDKPGYFSLGKVKSGPYNRYWKVWIFGSHRGHHPGHYMEVQHHIITCGDKCSSYRLEHKGRHTIDIYNVFKNRDQGQLKGNGDVDLQRGEFDIRFKVNPVCGANFRYTYRFEYHSPNPDGYHETDDFKPNYQKCWHFQNNKNAPAPYYASDCTKSTLEDSWNARLPARDEM